MQGKFWMLTIPHHSFTPFLPRGVAYIKGQLERGVDSGYLHWQLIIALDRKLRLRGVKDIFGAAIHAELTNSPKASEYVWKDETSVPSTRFELGAKPFRRNSSIDWDHVWDRARARDLMAIPAHTRLLCFRSILSIAAFYDTARPIQRTVYVFWGRTNSGKSRRAWEEATMEAYTKDPRSKFWCGYRDHENVVIDEFRGGIDISHLLRWTDRYPVMVEIKGSSVPLVASKIWITSNISPDNWYPDIDQETLLALRRRLNITHFT